MFTTPVWVCALLPASPVRELPAGLIHGSAVAYDNRAVLILGSPGSGKSALCAEIITRNGVLVADDQVLISKGTPPQVSPAQSLEGLIEMRGMGLIELPYQARAPLYLCVNLDAPPTARMPEKTTCSIAGQSVAYFNMKGVSHLASAIILYLRAIECPS